MHERTLYHLSLVGIQKGLNHTLRFAAPLFSRAETNLPGNSDRRCLTALNGMCMFTCTDWCWTGVAAESFVLWLKQQK